MEVSDALSPIDYRYLSRDEELRSKVNSYSGLDLVPRVRRIIPEILIPRLNYLESKLEDIARENKGKEIFRRTDGQLDCKTTVDEIFDEYSTRLDRRISQLEKIYTHIYGSEAEINEYLSDIVYYAVSAFSVEANIADDIRQLFRSEIQEFSFKEFGNARIGSSTMPHKMNPAEFENIKSLWKAYVPRVTYAILSQITEHQGDSTNEDFPYFAFELLIALSYATKKLENSLGNIIINAAE
mgnify:FL=1